jgi:membrane peptidoglycan carboxypeptidase
VTLANGGMYRPPKLVEATIDADGVRKPVAGPEPHRVISPETAGKLQSMLTQVVQTGTGTNAAVPGYLAAGKTGTARKPMEGARGYSGKYVASFVGFVPAQDPRLAAVVVLDEPTPIYGGQVSAPVFSRIMQYALRLERIPPPPGSPVVAPGGGPTHALDEAPANDDPNVSASTTTSTTKPASKSSTSKSSTTTTTKPAARSSTKSPTTTTTMKGSTTKSTSTTTTTRPKSTSPSTTTTTRPRSTTTTTSGTRRTSSSASPSSSTTTTTAPAGASSGKRGDTLGRGEGRSSPPSSGQAGNSR